METFNAFGFTNFWGVTPAYNILQNENIPENSEINILISNSNDIRHILKTIFQNFENKKKCKLRFYFYERNRENISRALVLFHVIQDTELSMRDRVELFMEIYGNTLLSSRTADYLNGIYKTLINFVANDKKYIGVLKKFIDFSNIGFREKDEIMEILKAYDLKVPFEIEKYRDDRLRYMFKERYDHRANLVDWDYCYKLKDYAPVIHANHYTKFRLTGITFEMRINSYYIPNRTLSSYIPGKTKTGKDSCLVRGFWGDITNSPFIGFGVELNTGDEHETFYAKTDIHHKFHAQHITEWNLSRYFTRLEKDELHELKFTEHKIPKKKENEKEEKNNENEKIEIKDVEKKVENFNIKENEEKPIEILMGFEYMDLKILPLTGDIEQIFKKKKYKKFFDFVVLGFHSKNIFENLSSVLKDEGKVFAELNSFMAAFDEKEKIAGKESYRNLGKDKGFILEDQSCKYIWKYIRLPEKEEDTVD